MRQKQKERLSIQVKVDLERFEQNQKVVLELRRQLKAAEDRMNSSQDDAMRSLSRLKELYKMEEDGLKLKIVKDS